MTGNKRFKLIGDNNLEFLMQHQIELPIYDYQNNNKRLSLSDVLDLLNSFNDKNKILQKSIKRQQSSNDECCKYIEEVAYENMALEARNNNQAKQLDDLIKENKELKEKLDDILELTELTGMIHLRKAEIRSIIQR